MPGGLSAGTAWIPVRPRPEGWSVLKKSLAIGAPLLAIGAGALAVGNKFHEMRSAIITGTGASGKALKSLENSAKNVGKQTPEDFKKVGEAIAEMNTATGATGKPLEDMTKAVLNASRLLGEDGVANSKAFGRALNQWNIPAKDGAKTVDTLFSATQKYGIGLGETTKNLSKYGATLQNAGFSMKDSVTLFGRLSKGGIDLRRAMPGLNMAFRKWAEEGKKPKDELGNIIERMKGAKSGTKALALATKTFGAEGAQQLVTAARSGGLSLKNLSGDLKNTAGSVDDADKRNRTFGESWQLLKNKAMAGVEPLATKIFNALIGGMKWLNNKGTPWLKEHAGMVKVLGIALGVAYGATVAYRVGAVLAGKATKTWAAITKVAAASSKVFAVGVRLVNAAMRANPIGIVVTALTLLVAGFVLAYKKSKTFRTIVNGALNAVKAAASAVTDWFTKSFVPFFTKKIPAAFQAVKDWVKNHWKTALFVLLTGPMGLATVFIKDHWNAITDKFKAAGQWVKNTFKKSWSAVKGILSAPVQGGRQAIGGVFDKVRGLFRSVKDWVVGVFKRAWNGLKTILTDPVQAGRNILDNLLGKSGRVRNIFDSIVGWVTGFFKREWHGIKAIFTDPVQAAKDIFHNLLGPGGRVRTIFHNAVSAIGGIWEKLQNVAKKPIKFVINTVLNHGLIDAFNSISRHFKIPAIPHIPLPKGFETGGWTGPGAKHKPAGLVHADEFVVNKASRRSMERMSPGMLAHINKFGTLAGYVNGGRVWPVPGHETGTYPNHDGVDINRGSGWDDYGDKIRAAAAGRISYVGWNRGYGNAIFERGPYGELVYGHTSAQYVRAGQAVTPGMFIGAVGNTGHSSAPHLHFGFPGGTTAQALAFLSGADVRGGGTGPGGGGFNPLSAFTGKIGGVLDKIGGLKDSYFGKLVAAIPSRLVEVFKKVVGKFGTAAGVGTSVAAQNTPGFGLLGAIGSHLFDQGGVLPPGLSLAVNGTGRNEHMAVLTNEQMRTLRNIPGGEAGTRGPVFSGDIYVSDPVDIDLLMSRAGFALSAGGFGG